jgi:hypothetical protein
MSIIRQAWNYVIARPGDIAFAVILAIVFAVFADFWQPASRFRGVIRRIKNLLARGSATRLRTRITEMERYRGQLVAYVESDKAHYLAALQHIFGILLLMCGGAVVFGIGYFFSPLRNQYNLMAILVFVVAGLLSMSAIRITSWNSHSKLSDAIFKLDGEIAQMKAKLQKL